VRYEVTGDLGNADAAYDESLRVSREARDRDLHLWLRRITELGEFAGLPAGARR
jgi:hypothetical protein